MKILVIDYLSYKGHKNFNQIHINALLSQGHTLELLGKEGHFDNITQCDKVKVSSIPSIFYHNLFLPQITARINFIICLLWVRFKYCTKNYDLSLILTYDPLSVFAFRSKKPVVLITHDGHYLDNKIKLSALKLTPKHYIHIGLSEEISDHIKSLLPNRRVYHIPHGLYQPSLDYVTPSYIKDGEDFLFCPINMKYEKQVVNQIMGDERFHKYLEENNTKLYVKKQVISQSICEMIVPIENDIPKKEYDYMMQNATAVLLPYEKDYKYRCSAIMLECVIRDTPVMATRLEAWSYLKDSINLIMFDNVIDIINGLDFFKTNSRIKVDKSIFDPTPYWKSVLLDL